MFHENLGSVKPWGLGLGGREIIYSFKKLVLMWCDIGSQSQASILSDT